ncbi:hypothetical protein Q3G72_023649 [Acer saccharum]|nr:hypothetical protein Q3G72_023649 [Acer saccharum]
MVLLSLTLQILLSILGNSRKNNRKLWIRVVVWSAYIGADSVATFALGILSSNITDMYGDNTESIDGNTQLTAIWAPFLRLHLGGPDSITAYALEDNELWLRHLLGLVVQTGMALYVFLMAWTGSSLSILSLTMFFPWLIKYGERTWVLRSARNEKRRNSMLRKYDFDIKDNIFHDDYKVKIDAGYVVGVDRIAEIVEVQLLVDLSGSDNNNSISEEDKLLTAYGLLNISKRLFVDATLNSRDRDTGYTIFRNLLSEDAFKVKEMELGLIYELLYPKMSLFYTPWGLLLPCWCFSPFLFTRIARLLDGRITCPNTVLCLNRKAKPLVSKIYPNYAIKRDWWSQWNTKNIPEDLRKLVYHYFKQKAEEATTTGNVAFTALPTIPGGGEEDSRQSPVEEFDYSIIIWHIATEVWYYTEIIYFH